MQVDEFMPKGIRGFQKGHSVPEEIKQKFILKMKGKHFSPRTELKPGNKLALGYHYTPEQKHALSEQRKGEHSSPATEIREGQHVNPATEFKKGHLAWNKGKSPSDESRRRMSHAAKKRWQDPEQVARRIEALGIKPNKIEKEVDSILQSEFPGEWKYNGDFSCGVMLGRRIPDFVNVNGRKAVIEVFGEPWHIPSPNKPFKVNPSREEAQTRADYSRLGYTCYILWHNDLVKGSAKELITNMLCGGQKGPCK